jgi:hypothetical protein
MIDHIKNNNRPSTVAFNELFPNRPYNFVRSQLVCLHCSLSHTLIGIGGGGSCRSWSASARIRARGVEHPPRRTSTPGPPGHPFAADATAGRLASVRTSDYALVTVATLT